MVLKKSIYPNQFINVPTHLRLSFYQRNLLNKAIFKGIAEGALFKRNLFTNKHHRPLEYDLVNEEIYRALLEDKKEKHLSGFEITVGKAGSHEYIKLFDVNRNISVIICRLPLSQNNFEASNYRAEHAYNNLNRLYEESVDFDKNIQEVFQPSFKFDDLSSPFGIIVFYDSINKKIFEGAQTPSQEQWIYLDDISNVDSTENIIAFTSLPQEDINLPLKTFDDSDEEINLLLK